MNTNAFPTSENDSDGMALLDYFAAKAMQVCLDKKGFNGTYLSNTDADSIAAQSYRMASAMLKERNKQLN